MANRIPTHLEARRIPDLVQALTEDRICCTCWAECHGILLIVFLVSTLLYLSRGFMSSGIASSFSIDCIATRTIPISIYSKGGIGTESFFLFRSTWALNIWRIWHPQVAKELVKVRPRLVEDLMCHSDLASSPSCSRRPEMNWEMSISLPSLRA